MDDTYLVVAAVRAVRARVAVIRVVAIRVVATRSVATVANVDHARVACAARELGALACVVACVARSKSDKQSQEEQKTHREERTRTAQCN